MPWKFLFHAPVVAFSFGFNEKNMCAVNPTFYAELGWQWKHFNCVGNLICLTVASYLSSSLKRELSLELACAIMEW